MRRARARARAAGGGTTGHRDDLPDGFAEVDLSEGSLGTTTAAAFAPDGRKFVAEKKGASGRSPPTAPCPQPRCSTFGPRSNDVSDRGLLGIAADEDFESFTLRPGRGPVVGDVGNAAREELDLIEPGRNYGWPCYEDPEDGPLPESALAWKTLLHHATHIHDHSSATRGRRLRTVSRRAHGRSLRVKYRLSEAARVRFRLQRAAVRRRGCARRCLRWSNFGGRVRRAGRRGANRFRLVIRGARPGRYRLSAYARDRAGNRAPIRRVRFRLGPRR